MDAINRTRRKFSAAEISELLKRYRQSGKNRQEFCDLEMISYSSLGNWLRRGSRHREKIAAKRVGGFIALDVSRPTGGGMLMQMNFPGGRSLIFYAEPRLELMKELLA